MIGWLLGNLALLSMVAAVCSAWFAYGALLWSLGLAPDSHPSLNVLGAFAALACGYAYSLWLIRLIRRLQYRRAIRA